MNAAVFSDGVRLVDLQAAMQAAYAADDFVLVVDLAKRYGLYDKICLRCVRAHIGTAIPPSDAVDRRLGWLWYQLCMNCAWEEVKPGTRRVIPPLPVGN